MGKKQFEDDVEVLTPKGEAIWPKLVEPDTKYKAEGEYSVKLKLSEKDAKELLKIIDDCKGVAAGLFAEAKGKKAKVVWQDMPFKPHTDEDGEETGFWVFTFKMTASGVSKKTGKQWTRRPALFDASNPPKTIKPEDCKVSGGSMIKVAGVVRPFYLGGKAGVALKLEAAQIIELREWGGAKSASSYGFGGEDGGYSHDEKAQGGDDCPFDDDDAPSQEGDPAEADF